MKIFFIGLSHLAAFYFLNFVFFPFPLYAWEEGNFLINIC